MKLKYVLLFFTIISTIISYIGAKEPFTWWLEAAPVFVGIVALLIFRKFEFTNLVYIVIFNHFLVLLLGAHYTYAEVPGFGWMNNFFGGTRNNYDKIGHFIQGFSPALIAREVLIRKKVLHKKSWLSFLVICIVLAISAFYEMIEWVVSLFSGESGDSFLGTQGYIWDTQTDMFTALIGGLVAVILFSKFHDRQILKKINHPSSN